MQSRCVASRKLKEEEGIRKICNNIGSLWLLCKNAPKNELACQCHNFCMHMQCTQEGLTYFQRWMLCNFSKKSDYWCLSQVEISNNRHLKLLTTLAEIIKEKPETICRQMYTQGRSNYSLVIGKLSWSLAPSKFLFLLMDGS